MQAPAAQASSRPERENEMAESTKRGNNTFCVVAANLIVVVGVLAFVYVGQQMSQGTIGVNVVPQVSKAVL
jgi:hypothetical protein